MTPRGLTPAERLEMKTIRRGPTECHPWIGARSGPYGKLFLGRDEFGRTITVYAHRFANELAFGPIPPGIEVDHTCEDVSTRLDELNTLCMNPAHHERVGGAENKRRQGERKTVCKHGHLYTAENTYIDGRGQRRCRRCAQERRRAA